MVLSLLAKVVWDLFFAGDDPNRILNFVARRLRELTLQGIMFLNSNGGNVNKNNRFELGTFNLLKSIRLKC